ncbi:tyrosinase family oxidase copper chaperone [Streptomyces sp. NPDC057403]|uniref:tyrosinase family oxidase copper chaperone n=1 Tax=Streptomyces sp. NPDC057403 TaxID=3346119 RepID=UPI0036C4ABFA
MVVSVGREAVRAEQEATRPRPAPPARRTALRGLLATAAAAVALVPVVAASRSGHRAGRPVDLPFDFDEVYRGRRIRGRRTVTPDRAVDAHAWQVTVDARPLHLMRRADGGWLSMVDHYCSYPTPLEAARAAVDELGPGERLRATDVMAGRMAAGSHAGGHHGVHA